MNQDRFTGVGLRDLPSDWTGNFHMVVVEWFDEHGRDFPWRRTSNPFHILVAEVLLRRCQGRWDVGRVH